jgi:hypothetical protein
LSRGESLTVAIDLRRPRLAMTRERVALPRTCLVANMVTNLEVPRRVEGSIEASKSQQLKLAQDCSERRSTRGNLVVMDKPESQIEGMEGRKNRLRGRMFIPKEREKGGEFVAARER